MVRKIAAGLAAAVVAGVVVGALSRALMALVAFAAEGASQFSWAGSAGILAIYTAVMVPGALLAAFTRRWARNLLLAAGSVFLSVPAVGVASEEVGGTAHFTAVQWALVGTTGIGVMATVVLLPFVTVRVVDRLLGRVRLGRPLAPPLTTSV